MVDFEKGHAVRMAELERTSELATNSVTLRDYFATHAMGALMENSYITNKDAADVAKLAYEMADAMLEARITLPPQPQPTVEEAFGFKQQDPGSWVEIKK